MANEVRKTFYDRDYIPKNIEDLYCSGWKEYLLYNIKKYSLHDVNHSPQDLLQDMMVQLATTNYIEKFDPEVADFTVYLKTFVRNFMSKPYTRENKTVNGSNIVNYMSLVSGGETEADDDTSITYDTLPINSENFADYVCLVNSIESDLSNIKTKSKVNYNGKEISRDPLTVYTMLKDGYDIKEIAEIFGTSKQFVYGLRKKILDVVASYV